MRLLKIIPFFFTLVLMSENVFALTVLKQIHVENENEIKMIFDSQVQSTQSTIEYINDIIQISIKGVSVYPAKIINLENNRFTKIFAYQYSPQVVRCRFSVNGKAEDYKDHFSIQFDGKVISTKLSENIKIDQLKNENFKKEKEISFEKPSITKNLTPIIDDSIKINQISAVSDPTPIKSSQALPSISSVFLKFLGVLVLLVFSLFIIKGLKQISLKKKSGIIGTITQFAAKNFSKDKNLIEVVSTHHLDSKKSIAIVKVAGRMLVLGVSSESIQLITQLKDQPTKDFYDEEEIQDSEEYLNSQIFSSYLGNERTKPNVQPFDQKGTGNQIPSSSSANDARSRIRSRLEGLKPL